MVAVREHLAEVAVAGVDRARGVDRKALHAAGQRPRVRRLDDQVNVVVLDRDVDDAEVAAAEVADQDAAERAVDATLPQARHVPFGAQRDVHRVTMRQYRPGAVRTAAAEAGLWTTRATTGTTVGLLRLHHHLE